MEQEPLTFSQRFLSYTSVMSRFSNWVSTLLSGSDPSEGSASIAADFGSAQTKIVLQDKTVFHQPTCIALHRRSGEVVAVGQLAADLLGKTPPHIEVIFPIRRGRVHDVLAAQLFMKAALQKILQPGSPRFSFTPMFHPALTVALPLSISTAEKEMFRKLLREIQFPRVLFRTQLDAAYHHLQKQKKVGRVFALVNIGAMNTEMAFFAQGEIVVKRSLALGGDDFTRVIVHQVQKKYHCQVGWQTAEKVKMSLGFGHGVQQNKKMVVRGRDILTSLPATIQVSAEDFMAGYQVVINDLIQHIADLFQDAPPEVMAEGLDQGVMFTGGGSLLTGLSDAVENHLRSPIHISSTALEDVVKGVSL